MNSQLHQGETHYGYLRTPFSSRRAFSIKSSVVAANTSQHCQHEHKNYASLSFEPSFWEKESWLFSSSVEHVLSVESFIRKYI